MPVTLTALARPDTVVNLAEKVASFSDQWAPRIIGELNGLHIKAVKVEGKFVWHAHDGTDELFLVMDGHLTIELRNRSVELDPGEFFVVPRGVEHRPKAAQETAILTIESAGTTNTGNASTERASTAGDWI